MFCSISGEAPTDAVICLKTGHLYERRHIEKAIKDSGKCPVTGKQISLEDLVSVVGNKSLTPRSTSATSIPNMLTMFQNEWDEAMTEVFTLRQHLEATRQELSQALYQHDAACRVIARLMVERDEARAMIMHMQQQGFAVGNDRSAASTTVPMEETQEVEEEVPTESPATTEDAKLWEAAVSTLQETSKVLSGNRKARTIPVTLVPATALSALTETSSYNPHKNDKTSGITCLQRDPDTSSTLVLTGGLDKDAILSDLSTGKAVTKFSGHKKKVNQVAFHPKYATSGLMLSASADATLKVWKASEKAGKSVIVWNYTAESELVDLAVHASGSYILTCTGAGSWALLDLAAETALKTNSTESNYACGAFHPDGLLFALGDSQGALQIWDARTSKKEGQLQAENATSLLECVAFSENGYTVATGHSQGVTNLWDLRKQKCTKSASLSQDGSITSLGFDHSGTYLAMGSSSGGIDIKVVKDWSDVVSLSGVNGGATTGLGWGEDGVTLACCSLDKTIKLLTAAAK